jgi:DNA-binding FrmR family transcriptional regulator
MTNEKKVDPPVIPGNVSCDYCGLKADAAVPRRHAENIRRLKSIEGHVRGIQKMLDQDTYCIDVIHQIQAVQAALSKIAINVLEQHLNSCVITAVRGENVDERERVLRELTDVFAMSSKV